jgi:hypothetical protein
MNDPIFPDDMNGDSDDYQLELFSEDWRQFEDRQFGNRGERAYSGPAGEVSLELDTGLWITIDFAEGDPGRVVSITIDADCRSAFLVDLFGGDRAMQIEETRGGQSDVTLRAVRGASMPLPPTLEAEDFIRIAKSISISEDPVVHDVVRAAATLEAIEEMRRARIKAPAFDGLLEDLLGRASRLLEAEEPMLLLVNEQLPKTSARFAGLCSRNVSTAPELERYCRILESGRYADLQIDESWNPEQRLNFSERDRNTSASAEGDRPGTVQPTDSLSLRPLLPSRIELSEGGLLEVISPTHRPDTWVRVFASDSLELLALAELREREDGSSIATTLVAPGTSLNEIACEILDGPRPIEGSVIERVANAVRLGRRATRSESGGEAQLRWKACADAWEQLGDLRRAAIAKRYVDSWRRNPYEFSVAEEIACLFERFGIQS